ncbi:RCC1 repeat-containing protein [Nannocystaceae bacterium ST9]
MRLRSTDSTSRPGLLLGLLIACSLIAACWSGPGKSKQPDDADEGDTHSTSPKPSAIAAGKGHTCVLREAGTVACWGRNDQGQLGDGTIDDRSKPVAVGNAKEIVELALGSSHTCARRRSGAVLCWGANDRGQLGNAEGGPGKSSRRPVAVHGLSDATALASGDDHVCALRAGGPMVCWGDNRDGQLGNDSQAIWNQPVPLRGVVDATAITAGSRHTCALRPGGKPICWGANSKGQLGDGTSKGHDRPSVVEGVPALLAIAAGGERTCGLSKDAAFCWGELEGKSNQRATKIAEANPSDPITQIEVGPAHACLRQRGGQVRCWGRNGDGRLGTGDFATQTQPRAVTLAGAAIDVALGSHHTCALRVDGKVSCWGDDAGGALGRGDPVDEIVDPGGPRQVRDITDARALDAGDGFACALRESGQVWCWGRNDLGQLGDGTSVDRPGPAAVEGIEDAVALSLGQAQVCVARKTGVVVCWGANDQGQLGRPAGDPIHKPLPAKVDKAIAVSLGSGHACAIQQGGNVLCWGSDSEGQLGDGAGARGGKVANVPDAIALSSGRAHTCALRSSGAISCWGSNSQGQLGNGAGAAQLKIPANVPVAVSKVPDAASITAGPDHTCALKRDGKVVCWGRNDAGQLGSGTASNVWTSRVPVADLANVGALDVGVVHACAAMPGRLACWGDNAAGQGGFEGASATTPRASLQGLDVAELALGRDHSCARLRSGEVACWGANDRGQLGDGGRSVVPDPVEVEGL